MLGRIDQGKRHYQPVRGQQRTQPRLDPAPQEHHHHRRHPGMQRGNGRHQVDAGLPRVDQRARRLQMQRAPAPCGDPLHERVRAGLMGAHHAQQAAVGHIGRVSEHAVRVGRAGVDVGGGAAGGRPGRRGRQQHVDDQSGERQCDEPAHKSRPIVAATQPQQSGHDVGQDEKRHVDAADGHLPPGRLRLFELLLQPHRRGRPEEQPTVHPGL